MDKKGINQLEIGLELFLEKDKLSDDVDHSTIQLRLSSGKPAGYWLIPFAM